MKAFVIVLCSMTAMWIAASPGFSIAEETGSAVRDIGSRLELFGDSLSYIVFWNTGGDLSGQAGKPVRLRFVMKDADLYAVRFR